MKDPEHSSEALNIDPFQNLEVKSGTLVEETNITEIEQGKGNERQEGNGTLLYLKLTNFHS